MVSVAVVEHAANGVGFGDYMPVGYVVDNGADHLYEIPLWGAAVSEDGVSIPNNEKITARAIVALNTF